MLRVSKISKLVAPLRNTSRAKSPLLKPALPNDGLPHLISDGRFDRAGEFTIPALMFLYIAGWIGWVGRAYLIAIHKDPATAAQKEIILDLPLALKFSLTGFAWPLAAIKELTSGELVVPESEVTVSPR